MQIIVNGFVLDSESIEVTRSDTIRLYRVIISDLSMIDAEYFKSILDFDKNTGDIKQPITITSVKNVDSFDVFNAKILGSISRNKVSFSYCQFTHHT